MKVYVEAYGCTANKSDASLVRGVVKQKKHQLVQKVESADVLVILTCTVIGTTEQRMLSRLRELKKTGKKIIVSGCMPAVQSDLIKKILPDATQVPPTYVHYFLEYDENKKDFVSHIENKTVFPRIYEDINAPIMISEGCLFSCSYCITCKARGKLKSFPANEIKNNVKDALKQGCKEIRLTAQDTASYGFDIGGNLGELLEDISDLDDDFRVRVGMMNPFMAMKNLDEILKGFDSLKIYKFLHLPVQSGDDKILAKMKRKYNVEEFKEIVATFRKKFPDLTLSTDVIVGFPSETEKQFQNTVSLLKTVKPDVTNITRFSPRPLTEAKKMSEKVDSLVAKKRSTFLTELCGNISKETNKKYVGQTFDILVTKKGKNKTMMGRNKNYKPVVVKRDDLEIGDMVFVEIVDAESTYLVGNI